MNEFSDKKIAAGSTAVVGAASGRAPYVSKAAVTAAPAAPGPDNASLALPESTNGLRFQITPTQEDAQHTTSYRVTERRRRRRWKAPLAFLLMVALPTAAVAYYHWEIATPQYVSEFQFGVRSADSARNDATAIFNGMAAASQIGLDSYMIVEFVQSRAMLEHLDKKMDFETSFGASRIDELSRLKANATTEEKLDYWRKQVEPYFDLTTGAIYVRVRAFEPETAKVIGDVILERATMLVNEMSQQIRDDALSTANKEVAGAEQRLKKAVADVQNFRDQNSRIDPTKEADAGLSSTKALSDEISRLKAQLAVQRSYLSSKSPVVVTSERRIAALEGELASLRKTLTSSTQGDKDNPVLSQDIGAFSTLSLEQRFAEEHYSSALTTLTRAKITAEQQVTYLAVFVEPTTPSSSTYPDPIQRTIIAFAACFGLWLFLLILLKSIKDR